ncbi:MAG: DEAD/DEAH box helicase [Epsilonproteobacteria bacterium]|nr:DEAD/DEAH box helicase [Campylobacterota bacterium]
MNENTTIKSEFLDFGFRDDINKGIKNAGFKAPSPIQSKAIPLILEGRDLIAQANTGTGKTAAFGLPAMNKIADLKETGLLVITPTRELATQVADELYTLGKYAGIRTATVYGGSSYSRQLSLIEKGAQVVVATPGRLKDLLSSGKLKDFNPEIVVLDEADEMLDMGFLEDIRDIFSYLPQNRQTILCSATMPKPIRALAEKILDNPATVSIVDKNDATNKDIKQSYYVIDEKERTDALVRLIEHSDPKKAIIFCRMKIEVDRLADTLIAKGYSAKGLHGDMDQRSRDEVIKAFRSSKINILVATDVAARGLDVKDVSHVFNYHIPFDPESYVHRVGRTGRAGQKGEAITLITPIEFKELLRIQKSMGAPISLQSIPSSIELKEKELEELSKEIFKAKIKEEAALVLSSLSEDIDSSEIALKAISLLLAKHSSSGPEHIGFSQKEAKRLLEKFKSSNKHSGSRGKRGGRSADRNRRRRNPGRSRRR